ncbi:MAG: hypothetical protein GVY29_07605 [Spirochaetes bacterium]|jgi:hypothetical protein|nr:hypothetical protein [Spirochaetota bacterium]
MVYTWGMLQKDLCERAGLSFQFHLGPAAEVVGWATAGLSWGVSRFSVLTVVLALITDVGGFNLAMIVFFSVFYCGLHFALTVHGLSMAGHIRERARQRN